MSAHKLPESSRIALNLNSKSCPYDEPAFSSLDTTAGWLSHMAQAICMFVVNFDALAQASDFRIKRSSSGETRIRTQVSVVPSIQQNECSLTHRPSHRRSSSNNWTRQSVPMRSGHSAHFAPLSVWFSTWFWWYACCDFLLILMEWHR